MTEMSNLNSISDISADGIVGLVGCDKVTDETPTKNKVPNTRLESSRLTYESVEHSGARDDLVKFVSNDTIASVFKNVSSRFVKDLGEMDVAPSVVIQMGNVLPERVDRKEEPLVPSGNATLNVATDSPKAQVAPSVVIQSGNLSPERLDRKEEPLIPSGSATFNVATDSPKGEVVANNRTLSELSAKLSADTGIIDSRPSVVSTQNRDIESVLADFEEAAPNKDYSSLDRQFVIPLPVQGDNISPIASTTPSVETMLSSRIVESLRSSAIAVAEAIQVSPTLASTGEGEIRIELKNEILDGSKIRFEVDKGTLSVTIYPATQEVSHILANNLEAFQNHLEARVSVWRINVGVSAWSPKTNFKDKEHNV